ncbi:DNA polymerase III subunit gamma/tau [Sulfurifustis variabilis]|uniref:DNA polymerase III subunit gamma/tau n=1 Tax=Sulfurifustis variabilis TaxID=1675686 RepID=A0A1B4V3M8_9GAMM|nr:DNA polymerase III subunit gamma/tau [Sulfurifustis variabilis]BAU48160.1 DNA polymerase III subunit gamma/tau [Sulfurifustis variabilis]
MSYQVLARKWRPRTFAELVGQSHVVRPLVNALERDRLHHAFLFTGTRGVGKTTIARILAKSLNCETGVTSQPCGKCSACVEVDEGRFIDLLEVDAASRTKVDDTRELLENVQYAPTRGRYKVYLIDEVHMLSGHSFNALLKTLEEPPPHVKFLLATTDPQKLPVTVLSRCLQFSLKRLSPDEIAAQLEKILEAETIAHDRDSIRLLARAADGSMRDGLSLLDQAIAFGGGQLNEADVRAMLGTIDQDAIDRVLSALSAGEARELLAVVRDVADHGIDCTGLLDEMLMALHRIALLQADPSLVAEDEAERLRPHAAAIGPEDVQLYYQIGLLGCRDLPLATDPRTGVEMTLLRMLAFRPAPASAGPERSQAGEGGRNTRADLARAPATAPSVSSATRPSPSTPAESPVVATTGDWAAIVEALGLAGLVRELANNTAPETLSNEMVSLVLDESCGQFLSKDREASLKQALDRHFGQSVRLSIRVGKPPAETPAQQRARSRDERQQAAVEAINSDPNVRALREKFNARVNPDTIKPAGTARQS